MSAPPTGAHRRRHGSTGRRPKLGRLGVVVAVAAIAGTVPFQLASSAAGSRIGFWSDKTTPISASADDAARVELGLRFRSSAAGSVVGVRSFKAGGDSGTHTGSLWSAAGQRLATATFTGETGAGWQTATFPTAVALQPGSTYVVSYLAPQGHYSYQHGGFRTQLTRGPLTAPRGANGVYTYGGGFPTSSYRSTNSWVDPVFAPGTTGPAPAPTATATPTRGPAPTSTAPTPTAAPTIGTVAPTTPTSRPTTPSPTATRTTTAPAPPPASCSGAQVWQNLDACGWPGPASTGYPAGQVFNRTVTGGLVVTAAGTVIDGYKVSGGIQVRARNVVIRNSWITDSAGGANGSGVVNINPGASATIEHDLLDGSNATHARIWHEGGSMTATANECRGVNDGIFSWATQEGVDGTGDNFRIEGNWLHAFTTQAANGHIDGYQTEGAKHGVIRHNTIDVSQDQNSAVAIWNGRKSSADIAVEDNLLTGGGFTVYAEDYSPSEASPAGGYTVTGVSFINNRFSTVHYGCVGGYGVWFPRGAPTDGWHRSGNTVLETGADVDAGNPSSGGRACN